MTYATAKTAFEAAVAAGPEDTIPPATLRSTVLGMTDALLGLIPAYSGDWLTATVYAANTEFVTNDGASYICIQNHTSGASTEPGTGASWTAYWQTLAAKGQDLLTGTIDVASATTTNIGAANSNVIRVTGTTTITSFGTEVDRLKFVYFAASLTLTHNATTLVLPGGANIATAAGDSLIAISDASGNWRVINYQYASDVDKDIGLDLRSITDVASAGTVDLGAETRDILRITGTTGITSFGTGANKVKLLYFAAALTITHNGTSLILPGAANLTVAANDALIVASDASGNWRTLAHFDADAAPQSFAPTTVASATTTDIGAAETEVVSITGTTTITSFGTTANKRRIGTFAGILTLTHNATTLILPTGADITTAAGDCFIAVSDGSGNWRVVSYLRADGTSLAGGSGIQIKAYGETTLGSDSSVTASSSDVQHMATAEVDITSGSTKLLLRTALGYIISETSTGVVAKTFALQVRTHDGSTWSAYADVQVANTRDDQASSANITGSGMICPGGNLDLTGKTKWQAQVVSRDNSGHDANLYAGSRIWHEERSA